MSTPQACWHFRDLVVNDDGSLSRTQITLWLVLVLTIGCVVCELLVKPVLSWKLLAVLAGLHAFALMDRIHAKYMAFHVDRGGVGMSMGEDPTPTTQER